MRNRCIVGQVTPELEYGKYRIKRIPGQQVRVSATIFTDGDDALKAVLSFRHDADSDWSETPMVTHSQDVYEAEFTVEKTGTYQYRIIAWPDELLSWYQLILKKHQLGQPLDDEFHVGQHLLTTVAPTLSEAPKKQVLHWVELLRKGNQDATELILSEDFAEGMQRHSLRCLPTIYDHNQRVRVGRAKEQFSTWYLLFPRSTGDANRPGTFETTADKLPRLAELGFDTLLLPPVFPIGKTNRKGRNNSVTAQPDDPGSPWSVGNETGGHKSVNPDLGSMEDFEKLLQQAKEHDIELALDLGLACSPDHPYVKEYPQWFRWLPNGALAVSEVPPLRYQDILHFNFECEDWQSLWEELKSIVLFWADKGVRTFYSSTPHYKPFAFWHWLLDEVHQKHPDTVFLSGALTRNIIMEELAMAGFQQSLTYFMWKQGKEELEGYVQELIHGKSRDYLVPNFFVNTPDIFPHYLDQAPESMYLLRYALAATLGSSCGIYGPVFELMDGKRHPDSKERYLHSEKYEICWHDWTTRNRLTDFIAHINKIRRSYPAMQHAFNLHFTKTDNQQLLSFVRKSPDSDDAIIWCIINLDVHHKQTGHVEVPRELLGLSNRWLNLKLTDLLTGEVYHWFNDWNYVALFPEKFPLHVFEVQR